jgi:hypothetical protein
VCVLIGDCWANIILHHHVGALALMYCASTFLHALRIDIIEPGTVLMRCMIIVMLYSCVVCTSRMQQKWLQDDDVIGLSCLQRRNTCQIKCSDSVIPAY